MFTFNKEKTKRIVTSDPIGLRVIVGFAMLIVAKGIFVGNPHQNIPQLQFMLHHAPAFVWGVIFFISGIVKIFVSFLDGIDRRFLIVCSLISVSLWISLAVSGLFGPAGAILNNLLFVVTVADIWLLSYNLFGHQPIAEGGHEKF